MRNTLITLAVAATTAYARELQTTAGTTAAAPSYGADMLWMLEQRDSCLWQCKTAKCDEFPDYSGYNCYYDRRRQTSDEFEICFDTCYPELSRCRWMQTQSGVQVGETCNYMMWGDNQFWDEGFNKWVFEYAQENRQERVFRIMLDNRNSGSDCWPQFECAWEECVEEDFRGEDSCWIENCFDVNACSDDQICKVWRAFEYDYEAAEWLWEIEECEKDFEGQMEDIADDIADEAMNVASFAQSNFNGTLGMAAQDYCPNGVCVNQTAAMLADQAAMVAPMVPEVSFQNVSGLNLTNALEMFYSDNATVELLNSAVDEASNTFELDVSTLQMLINANNATAVEQHVEMTVDQAVQEQQNEVRNAVDEQDSWVADFLGAFVSGFQNSGNERRGSRDGSDSYYNDGTNDYAYDNNGNW